MGGIYAIKNKINNKYYIGQSKDFKQRWMEHRAQLRHGHHHNKHLQAAWTKYGEDSFEFSIVEECEDQELRNQREIYYIERYDAFYDGYNMNIGGGSCKGFKHTPEEIEKMRMVQNPKKVVQIDKNLNLVKVWTSGSQAGKELGLSCSGIRACCVHTGRQKTIGGYWWLFQEEFESPDFDYSYFQINETPCKRVSQYDLEMNLVQIFHSVYAASKAFNCSAAAITDACKSTSRAFRGYVFRYTDEYTQEQFEKDKSTTFKSLPMWAKSPDGKTNIVQQYTKENEFIQEFNSAVEAAEATNINRTSISNCCSGHSQTAGGYIWKYKIA